MRQPGSTSRGRRARSVCLHEGNQLGRGDNLHASAPVSRKVTDVASNQGIDMSVDGYLQERLVVWVRQGMDGRSGRDELAGLS
jgi:hypothetical protein